MPLLVTGAGGQLGRALLERCPGALGYTRQELDITDANALGAVDWSRVDAVVNAAAWTQVDRAESDDALDDVWRVNVTGVALLAARARQLDVPFVHVSTDYVFDGRATAPVPVDAPVHPLGTYGLTKAASEFAARLAPQHYVVRTSWVYGHGPNFVRTMLGLAESRSEVRVVADQRGRPTYAGDLADGILGLLRREAPFGTYHLTGSGPVISWAEFAQAVFTTAGTDCAVAAVTTEQYMQGKHGVAPRPAYSALDLARAQSVGVVMPDWRDALVRYLSELVPGRAGLR